MDKYKYYIFFMAVMPNGEKQYAGNVVSNDTRIDSMEAITEMQEAIRRMLNAYSVIICNINLLSAPPKKEKDKTLPLLSSQTVNKYKYYIFFMAMMPNGEKQYAGNVVSNDTRIDSIETITEMQKAIQKMLNVSSVIICNINLLNAPSKKEKPASVMKLYENDL